MSNSHDLAGIDEAGRGALAGPVVACCVVFKPNFDLHELLNDSKQLNEAQRNTAFEQLQPMIHCGIGIVTHRMIGKINILNSTMLAMKKAIRRCPIAVSEAVVDGNYVPYDWCESKVKADQTVAQVMAASICAKVIRDRIMLNYHRRYSQYQWNQNKGYGTSSHYDAIFDTGKCCIHRPGFNLTKQLTLF